MNNKPIKTATINVSFDSISDLRESLNKILFGISNGTKEVKNGIFDFGVVRVNKNYTPIRIETINGKQCEIFASKINEL